MSQDTLLFAFSSFVILVLIVAVILRKISVRDVFDDDSPSFATRPSNLQKAFPSPIKQSVSSGASFEKKGFALDRQTTYKIAKALSTIGIIVLFVPLPEGYKIFGLGLAFLGSMVAKATAPPKKKNSPPQRKK